MITGQKLACQIALIIVFTCCVVATACAQVEISSPTSGATVRGEITILASKPDTSHGWISYKIEGPGQSGDFTLAVTDPYRYVWDSIACDTSGKEIYPDGEYTITAVAYLPSGQKVGQDSVRVTLENELSRTDRPSSLKLEAAFKRGKEMNVKAIGLSRAKLIEHEDSHQKVIQLFNGALEADWRERAMSNSAGYRAIVRKYFNKGYTSFFGAKPANLQRVGDIFTMYIYPDHSITPKHKGDPTFELGELYMELPDKTVRRGSTWRSDMYVLPMLQAERRKVTASHRIDGFQWAGGYRCARIVSKYSENDVTLTLNMGGSSGQSAGTAMGGDPMMMGPGGTPDMGAMMGNRSGDKGEYIIGKVLGAPQQLVDELMSEGRMTQIFGPGGGAAGGSGGAAGGSVVAPAQAEITTSYEGVRVSYFAYELGQFVRTEDFISHAMEVDSTQFGGAMNNAAGGMMDPMMMDPMMDPMMGAAPTANPAMAMPPDAMGPEMAPMPMDPRMGGAPGMTGMGGATLQKRVDPKFKAEATIVLQIKGRG